MLYMHAIGGEALAQGSTSNVCANASYLRLTENRDLLALDIVGAAPRISHIRWHLRFKGAIANKYHYRMD